MSKGNVYINGKKFYRHPFFSNYAASRSWKVYSLRDNKQKKTFFNGAYYRFTIIHERRPIFYELDRFVYECVKSTRIPGCKVIHVDGDKKDNDNDNLDVEEIKEIEEDEE